MIYFMMLCYYSSMICYWSIHFYLWNTAAMYLYLLISNFVALFYVELEFVLEIFITLTVIFVFSRGLSGNGGPSGRRRRSASSDSEAGRSGGYSGSKPRSNSATRKPFTPSSAGARFPRFNPTA